MKMVNSKNSTSYDIKDFVSLEELQANGKSRKMVRALIKAKCEMLYYRVLEDLRIGDEDDI